MAKSDKWLLAFMMISWALIFVVAYTNWVVDWSAR